MLVRPDKFPYAHGLVLEQLFPSSQLLAEVISFAPAPNKAVVGSNAFAHEAGIHQHGMLAHPLTYEIMTPAPRGCAHQPHGAGQAFWPACVEATARAASSAHTQKPPTFTLIFPRSGTGPTRSDLPATGAPPLLHIHTPPPPPSRRHVAGSGVTDLNAR